MFRLKLFSSVLILALLLPLISPGSPARGEPAIDTIQKTLTISAAADATLKSWDPSSNFGNEHYLGLSYTREGQAATLIRFDTSSLPVGAIVDSANLYLFLDSASGRDDLSVSAYFVNNHWDESTVTWNSEINTGAYGINASIDTVVGLYKSWFITSFVQTWVDDPSSNHGVLLLGPASGTYYERWFESHEHNEHVPQLEIFYHVPVLSGNVYQGQVGDQTTPIAGVNVKLYCSITPGVIGRQMDSTTTNAEGLFNLEVIGLCDYYQIVATDLAGYTSVGATSEGGTVINSNFIEYSAPLTGKTLNGNKFWDIIPETELLIVAGPTVSDLSADSALISWQTSVPADSLVQFDFLARLFRLEAADPSQTTLHEVLLGRLTPSTTYHFKVRSAAPGGDSVESADFLFETLPSADSTNPTVAIIDPGIIKDTVVIQVEAQDNMGVKKVEFYWNGVKVFTDFTYPYEWKLSTGAGDNGGHTLTAKAYDLSGRSAVATRSVEVVNFIDKTAPQVHLFHPHHGDNVYGYTSVWVTVSDDSGWSDVELFVDGVKVTGGSFPVSPSLDIKFGWDTTVFPAGTHSLAVQATDGDGKVGTDVIQVTVANPTPPPEPNLVVTNHQVFRHGHTFAVELTIKNQGGAKASQVEIWESLTGFQAIDASAYGVDYQTNYYPNLRTSDVIISDSVGLAAGSSRTYIFTAIPVLMTNNPPAPEIGRTIEMSFSDSTGKLYHKPTLAFEVFKTTQTAGSAPSEALAQAHANAIKSSSYLIVTDPGRLFVNNFIQDNDQVLVMMAKLAFARSGVLGFLSGPNTDMMLDGLIEPGGDWATALNSNFGIPGLGYLLIVGETEIVPAWLERITQVSWSNSSMKTFEVNLSDLRYADTGGSNAAPELIVGRIIGNDAANLVNLLQNNLTGSFDRSHYLLVSGTDSNQKMQDGFVGAINDIDKLIDCEACVTKLHLNNISNQEAAYKNNAAGKDVIVYQGHGGVDSWDGLSTTQIVSATYPLSFGGTNPVVLSFACLTGSYEDHVSNAPWNKGGGDYNFSEAFHDQGAAVFVGSTEVSEVSKNRAYAKMFFNKFWKSDRSVGFALTGVKRFYAACSSITDKIMPFDNLWIHEYNLYGDPKYGIVPGGTHSAPSSFQQEANVQGLTASGALSAVDIVIPDYEVTPVGEFHEVDIPGGDLILEPGSYRIPFYMHTIIYPPGYEVQQVHLADRSGLLEVSNSGLNLPINEMNIAALNFQDQNTTRAADGWVPEGQFDWAVMEDPDGTLTLTIIMYPFYYDPATTDIRFYQNYSFEIDTILSPVTLTAMMTNKEAFFQGEGVQADVMVTNTGPAQDVSVVAVVKSYPVGEFLDGLPLQTLPNLVGDASIGFVWNTDGIEPGGYLLEVTLRNTENQVLDRITTTFQVGITSGEITQLVASPGYFEIGETIDLSLRFQNTGSVALSGTLYIKVFDPLGTLIETITKPFSDLAPRGFIDQETTWDSSGAEKGSYGIVGYALYHSKASVARQISISTEPPAGIFLPLIFR
ncbi:MAG: DNRLRE domain-containing protein [Brevefilum sp.]|nr:DNRLRE domain-containing protein [Brevefilum sp.]